MTRHDMDSAPLVGPRGTGSAKMVLLETPWRDCPQEAGDDGDGNRSCI